MLIRPVCVVLLSLFVIPALPQHVGSVDLTVPIPPPSSPQNSHLPSGCSDLEPGVIADGFARTEDGKPIDITVEITELSDDDPVEDGDVQLEIKMTNKSDRIIKIPWSLDPEVIFKDQSPTSYVWERGRFQVYVGRPKKGATPLQSLSRTLYGTAVHSETMLPLNPNESISAIIKVKVKSDYQYDKDSLAGDSELFVEWDQLGRGNFIRDCKVTVSNTIYMHYYRQDTPTVPITIEAKSPSRQD